MPVVSGIIRSKERAAIAMGCETFGEIEGKLAQAIAKPIPPRRVNGSPTREVTLVGDDVDLYKLPIPMSSIYDGGPMITAGVVIARDPGAWHEQRHLPLHRQGEGAHRHRHRHAEQHAAVRRSAPSSGKEPLPISISIGTHPFEITGSGYRAPLGVDEMAIAGGLRGEAVDLAPCSTIDMPYIADAEIVLEAEILPTGWTYPEGRFGEFTRLMGGLHWNPLVRIKAISMRKDAIYYNLHMPWENTWLGGADALHRDPAGAQDRQRQRHGHQRHARRLRVLARGDLDQEGAGRRQERAAAALVGDGSEARRRGRRRHRRQRPDRRGMGHRHARAGRQGRRHHSGRAGQALDPSLPQGAGVVPVGRKVGIDAPIPEGIPLEHYERITYAYADTAKVDDYVKGKKDDGRQIGRRARVEALATENPRSHRQGAAVLHRHRRIGFSDYGLQHRGARIGHLHKTEKLWQDSRGRSACADRSSPAVLPVKKYNSAICRSRMIIDTPLSRHRDRHQKYPLSRCSESSPTGRRSIRSDHPDMVAAEKGRRQSTRPVLVQASSAYAFDNSYVADFRRGASRAVHRRVLDRRGRARRRGEDEALDGQGPHRHAHLHLRLDPCRAGDVLRRRSRLPGLAIRQRPGPVGLHADAGCRSAAPGNRHQALSEGANPARPFRAGGSRRRPAVCLGRAAVGAVEISRTSISS
jgi:2,5-furandicarboxylate decarboxylase 1